MAKTTADDFRRLRVAAEEQDKFFRQKQVEQRLTQAAEALDYLVLATPTGEAREALTTANIFLTYARDLLSGKTPPYTLNDLGQQVADYRS